MTCLVKSFLFPTLFLILVSGLPCGAEPQPATEDQRAWIEPTGPNSSPGITIQALCEQPMTVLMPLVFQCELTSRSVINEAVLRVQISDPAGNIIQTDETDVFLGPEQHTYLVRWDATAAPPGEYPVVFSILRPPRIEVARRPYVIKKARWQDILTTYERGHVGIEELKTYDITSPYARMRLAVADAATHRAIDAMQQVDWKLSYRLAQYLCQSNESIRGLIIFGNSVPELSQPIALPAAANLTIRDGLFYADETPVFLLGRDFGTNYDADLAPLDKLAMNLAVYSVSPAQTLPEPDHPGIPPFLNKVFDRAQAQNVHVMLSLNLCDLPQWATEKWPFLADTGFGKCDVTKPEARHLIEQHMRTLLPFLATKERMAGLDIFYEPLFKFTGEDIRQGFLKWVKERYPSRHSVNQAWRGLFADLNEIAIGWDEVNPRYQSTSAYQYDWQTYHQNLGTDYVAALASLVRGLAPNIPITAAVKGNVFDPGESKFGLNREALLPLFDLDGCSAESLQFDPVYSMQYPGQSLLYTLLHSLAPAKPVVDFSDRILGNVACETPCSLDYVHAIMWDTAISGLAATALRAEDLDASPECLEGYATACLDLNRLANIVAAFQQAPPDVHILWSMPSKIYDNGSPYLSSVQYAYEGASFSGYKIAFITEREVATDKLQNVKVLVLPETPAVFDSTFDAIKEYVKRGGALIRPATQIQYNEQGHTRRDVVSISRNTVLVRVENLAAGYLSAMDAVTALNVLPGIPRTVTNYRYPLEGVKSRYVEVDGQPYLYLVNLRRGRVHTFLTEGYISGRDIINGQDVKFPLELEPLRPLLIRLDKIPTPPPLAPVQNGPAIPCK